MASVGFRRVRDEHNRFAELNFCKNADCLQNLLIIRASHAFQ
jgi:hypothetical protein